MFCVLHKYCTHKNKCGLQQNPILWLSCYEGQKDKTGNVCIGPCIINLLFPIINLTKIYKAESVYTVYVVFKLYKARRVQNEQLRFFICRARSVYSGKLDFMIYARNFLQNVHFRTKSITRKMLPFEKQCIELKGVASQQTYLL